MTDSPYIALTDAVRKIINPVSIYEIEEIYKFLEKDNWHLVRIHPDHPNHSTKQIIRDETTGNIDLAEYDE